MEIVASACLRNGSDPVGARPWTSLRRLPRTRIAPGLASRGRPRPRMIRGLAVTSAVAAVYAPACNDGRPRGDWGTGWLSWQPIMLLQLIGVYAVPLEALTAAPRSPRSSSFSWPRGCSRRPRTAWLEFRARARPAMAGAGGHCRYYLRAVPAGLPAPHPFADDHPILPVRRSRRGARAECEGTENHHGGAGYHVAPEHVPIRNPPGARALGRGARLSYRQCQARRRGLAISK